MDNSTSTTPTPFTVLIVGGAGYIGSHTITSLLQSSQYKVLVIVVDNLSSGHSDALKRIENDILTKNQRGQMRLELNVDITVQTEVDEVFHKYTIELDRPIDLVMHFGALIEVGESVRDPLKYYKNNVLGTMNVLESMHRYNVRRFIFSSTAAIFGLPKCVPIQPDDEHSPINPYGETKLCVEKLLRSCDEAYGIRFVALRYFNAAGAHESGLIGEDHHPESHLIPLILQVAAGKREKIHIFGTDYDTRDGTCVRDYVHVSDLADAHVRAANYLLQGGKSDVFNLGTNQGFTVREVIEACRRVTGHEIPAQEGERRPGDPDILVASPDKAREVLGWEIKYNNVEDIVRTAWRWHSNNPEGYGDRKK